MKSINYPPTPAVDQEDDYHGTVVNDPYRWLEDAGSAQTRDWIQSQNQLTHAFLDNHAARDQIKQRLSTLWDFPRSTAPRKANGIYFQLENNGLQDQDVLYVMSELGGDKRILLDPNKLSSDGTVALTNWEVSRDAALLAYAISSSGSDWQVWHIQDVNTGEDLHDRIDWCKFTNVAWKHDSSGFYYSRYDQPAESEAFAEVNLNQKVFFHLIGTSQDQDQLIYQRPDQPEWGFDAMLSDDGDFLILEVSQGTDVRNRLFYKNIGLDGEFVELIPRLEAKYRFIANDGSIFYLWTDFETPRGRLIAVDINDAGKTSWKTIIPEEDDTLETIKLIDRQFIALYLHDAHHQVKRFGITGEFLGQVYLPAIGSIFYADLDKYIFGGREDDEFFFTFNSFIIPPTVMRCSLKDDSCETINSPDIDFDPHLFNIHQVFVDSKDGTQVPMFLIHRRNLDKSGQHPALLYGYGGFNISITPNFLVHRLLWLELGGVLAVANLRGGGEYGEEWHLAGSILNKQNVFDDFISCAEYLIDEGYTSPAKLVIEGRSNGGLLVGACMIQRPELFAAALPAVGVMDMLRFHKFTIGWAWVSDYGSVDDPEQFKVLYSYSPLHNIKPGVSYPATLVTTADHDDRVVPGHSFKFIAALQEAQVGDAPVLIRIQTKSGHGFGKPVSLQIDELSDIYAFLVKVLQINTPWN